jgi:hypothetical protein
MTPIDVSDFRANLNETILFASRVIGKSAARRKVFEEIYRSKARYKTATEIARKTKLSNMRVLQEAGKLAGNRLVDKKKLDGETAYKGRSTFHHKARILSIAAAELRMALTTAPSLHAQTSVTVRAHLRREAKELRSMTESFKLVRRVKHPIPKLKLERMPEKDVKAALKRIIGETREFKDWGGEKNDLFTNKFRIGARRIAAAFALKGRATQGNLVPKKMGKNGDQLQRLFLSAAEAFFTVYHSRIDESVYEQMKALALAKAAGGQSVFFGVIDGDDLNRLY